MRRIPFLLDNLVIRGTGNPVTGDTGPTDRFRERMAAHDVKYLITETSFPNRLEKLSLASGHLNPVLQEIDVEIPTVCRIHSSWGNLSTPADPYDRWFYPLPEAVFSKRQFINNKNEFCSSIMYADSCCFQRK